MKQLRKPLTTKQVCCHNGKSIYHLVEITPNLTVTSGQPFMEVFDTKEALATKIKSDTVSFKSADKVALIEKIDEFVLGKEVIPKEVIEKVISK
jgi:hypothetical protein